MIGTHGIDNFGLKGVSILVFVYKRMAEAFVVVLLDFGSDLHEFEPIDEQVVVVDHLLLSFAFGVHIRERLDTIGEFVVLRKVMDDRFFDGAARVASHADDRGKRARFWVSLIFEEGGIYGFDCAFEDRFSFV